ncbi:hypothetical protein EDB92DRAFT_1940496 [Lactarius akahatsu]|uniref:Uncharacterized protein n=1 Tax=Lactarius akahatsu TaxID=416441 RepID=A0AAD4QHF7_9AGAM|nr:hypothetical protein EDB92DRAFT_1940496 [Lactarius akahatsu]
MAREAGTALLLSLIPVNSGGGFPPNHPFPPGTGAAPPGMPTVPPPLPPPLPPPPPPPPDGGTGVPLGGFDAPPPELDAPKVPPPLLHYPAVASLQLTIPEDDEWVEVFRRLLDDLPAHVLGSAYWNTSPIDPRGGYRCVINRQVHLIEFINNAWYLVERHFDSELRQYIHHTRDSLQIECENPLRLSWWLSEDRENPETLPPTTAPIQTEEAIEQIKEDIQLNPTPPDPVNELTEAFRRLTPIHTEFTPAKPAISTTPIHAPMATTPLTGALKGVSPTVFTGDCAKSKQFL